MLDLLKCGIFYYFFYLKSPKRNDLQLAERGVLVQKKLKRKNRRGEQKQDVHRCLCNSYKKINLKNKRRFFVCFLIHKHNNKITHVLSQLLHLKKQGRTVEIVNQKSEIKKQKTKKRRTKSFRKIVYKYRCTSLCMNWLY